MVHVAGDSGFIDWANGVDTDMAADAAALAAHLADTVDAHDATAVSFSPAQGIAATTVQAAIEEVVTDASATYQALAPISSVIPRPQLTQLKGGCAYASVESDRFHAFDNFGIYQVESLTDTQQGAAWTSKGIPAGVTASTQGRVKLIRFGGYYYGQFMAGSTAGIYRAAVVANPTAFTWSAALTTGAAGATNIQTAFATDGTYLYWGEYGDPSGGPSVKRSSDGTTWTTVLGPLATTRHCHGIFPDPYNAGHVYATFGDTTNPTMIYKSTDSGANWAALGGLAGTGAAWQAVQLSFDAGYIYAASDSGQLPVYRLDRTTLVPEWVTLTPSTLVPVPGGYPARRVTDLATTLSSTTVTSATAAFTSNDVGAILRTTGQDFAKIDSFIASVTNSTTAVLSKAATATVTGATAVISGEVFGAAGYYGAVDPDTGIYYYVALTGGIGGNTGGLFAVLPDGRTELLHVLSAVPDSQVFIANGYLYSQGYSRALLTLA